MKDDGDIRQAKDILAARIIGILNGRDLPTRAAGRQTGFAAGDFFRVRNANYDYFTLDRLIRILHAFEDTVKVSPECIRAASPRRRAMRQGRRRERVRKRVLPVL